MLWLEIPDFCFFYQNFCIFRHFDHYRAAAEACIVWKFLIYAIVSFFYIFYQFYLCGTLSGLAPPATKSRWPLTFDLWPLTFDLDLWPLTLKSDLASIWSMKNSKLLKRKCALTGNSWLLLFLSKFLHFSTFRSLSSSSRSVHGLKNHDFCIFI